MIRAAEFFRAATARGFGLYTGVPCSYLTPLINGALSDPALRYVGAVNEGEAVSLAAGAWLAGARSVAMMQNSGLGNAVNPLASLHHVFRIPVLLVITLRGEAGVPDEPQHALMGRVTGGLLDVLEIPWQKFPDDGASVEAVLREACDSMQGRSLPYALVMSRGAVQDEPLRERVPEPRPAGECVDACEHGTLPTRARLLESVLGCVPGDAAVIATTGKCGRELYTLSDREQHLYVVGSMGCASALGLGVALHCDRPVVVLDGDGAALMRMGTLATIGQRGRAGFVHVVMDNGVHDSTGGQATISPGVDFARVAQACGYARAVRVDSAPAFEREFRAAATDAARSGATLIHARMLPGSMESLGRPKVAPPEVARRFRAWLSGKTDQSRV